VSEALSAGALSAVRRIGAVSLGGACALAFGLLWRFPSPVAALLAAVTLLLAGLGAFLARPGRIRGGAGPLLLLAAASCLLLWPELTLRLLDFRHEAGVEFGFPRKIDFTRFAPDPDLFWTYPRGREGVNAMGFRDEAVSPEKPDGVVRLLFLGDSCTDLGDPNYPTRLERLVNGREPRGGVPRVESVVMAVSGYSSHQGRVAIEKFGGRLAPDAVIIYFGWNDHWRAFGEPDAEKQSGGAAGRLHGVLAAAQRSRTFQFLRRVADRLTASGEHTSADVVRVPLPSYRDNLRAIAGAARALGAEAVFITAPTTWYRDGVSQPHIDGGYVPNADVALDQHRRYNEAVREVAAETGALLLDFEREFESMASRDGIMIYDGIHFSSRGLDLLALRVTTFLEANHILATRGAS